MTRRSSLWAAVLVLLGLSIALNVFMVGYAARGLRNSAAAGMLIENVASIYPPEVRREFRAVMRENRPRTFAALRDLRTARAALAAAVKASPLDEPAVQAAMEKVRDATGNLQGVMQDYLLTALKRTRERPAS
ncbi:periplasmic heavy metal sensor [Mesorhizobium sp. CA13]|uniref:periplasmic heavy metal sensor n=1 Tax=unclassified Mesorhizobium TaxID=325217 RepID=UPI0011272C47|nr:MULTISPECIES: periplasmic heavy metal sensor [unclassified Mesorhizobium]MBZ9857417.1 periplasmic heavy metal sensor [Mesorhizobium sp. CA13]MBZ9921841.1 periplasmic heavy metal sensor [Mesorhizobium sp. BR1-1-7]MBZ9966625.1 periplasmic heavy metal sensor [Mesorhizobium sp. BR1-1-2]MCA0014785.1 periplasmic heavy metal sensor [Mesorhizobium sp. B294B1A1]MCA0041094.1 periplasmic heavy metal sensor [Mesorhizobium sp. B292B1B]